jgi:hypothetical protein
MKHQIIGSFTLALAFLVTTAAVATELSGRLGAGKVVMDTAIRLDAKSASELIGKRGIVMDTCRQPTNKPLMLTAHDGRNYRLADGIYRSGSGIQIHIRNGAIAQVTFSRRGM